MGRVVLATPEVFPVPSAAGLDPVRRSLEATAGVGPALPEDPPLPSGRGSPGSGSSEPATDPPPPPGGASGSSSDANPSSDDSPGLRSVALLLAIAAALAAIIAARSAMLSVEAGDAWQMTLRIELQRAAAALIDIRQVYGVEGDAGLMIREEEILAEELRTAAESAAPAIAGALIEQAQIHANVAAFLAPNADLADERYRLPDGGLDIERRIAELRAEAPDMVALDPDAHAEMGDRAFAMATRSISAALPLGLAFLGGALAMPLADRRRLLLVVGWLSVAGAVTLTVVVELGA